MDQYVYRLWYGLNGFLQVNGASKEGLVRGVLTFLFIRAAVRFYIGRATNSYVRLGVAQYGFLNGYSYRTVCSEFYYKVDGFAKDASDSPREEGVRGLSAFFECRM